MVSNRVACQLGMLLMWYEQVSVGDGSTVMKDETVFTEVLYQMGRQPMNQEYACGQDQLGSRLVIQTLIGFITPKLFELSAVAGWWCFHTKIKRSAWVKSPLKIEQKFIRNVYFQGLLWIAVPYLPLMSFLMPLMLYISFKFDKIYLIKFCTKDTAPFQVRAGLKMAYAT